MLAAAGAAALALSWSPPSPASADLNLTPTPTACTLPPPLTCSVPSPPPLVSSSPAPAPAGGTASNAPKSSVPSAAAPPKGAGGGAAAGVTGGMSVADFQLLQTTLGNSALVQQLVAILQNPTAAQRPDLQHFQPVAASYSGSLPSRPRLILLTVLLLAIPVLWMAAVPLLRLRTRPVAILASLVPAFLVGCLLVPTFTAKPSAVLKVVPRRTPPPVAWLRLATIENRLAAERASLVFIEGRLELMTAELETGESTQRVHPQAFATLTAMHDAESAVYEQDLEREYQVYWAAAQAPQLSAQLRQAAADSGTPAATRAVSANLQTIQTQLQQEATIIAAQARLQQLGFTPDQAKALQSHDNFVAPLGGPVGQPFGPTSFPMEPPLEYQGHFYPHFHTGIDIEAPPGAPVVSAADGVVALVATSTDGHGHTTGYGNYVVIAHAHGYYTLYAHLSGVLVKSGQLVHQGQPVGLVGTTGNSTGPHLHFEIRKDGEFLDPLPYVTNKLKPW